jgi:F-type H+-transporting ATPase subunit b
MRVWLRVLCPVAIAIAFSIGGAARGLSTCHAAEEEHAKAAGDENADAAPGPMTAEKQDVDLALWSLITFVVFLFVLKKFAWGPLINGLDKREANVLDNIAAAEAARVKAEKMLAEHAARLDKVQDEVREILAEARRDAEHTKNDIMAAAQKEAEATRQRAVQDIERARDQALDELFAKMGRAVSLATEQVIGRSVTGADNERLIEEALNTFAERKH